jgi:hypothetical protein
MAIKRLTAAVPAPSITKVTQPLTPEQLRSMPEFEQAMNFAKAITQAKDKFKALIKTIPLINRGLMINMVQKEMERQDYDLPTVDVQISSGLNAGTAKLVNEYILNKKALHAFVSQFSGYNKRLVLSELGYATNAVITSDDLDQPVPGVDKNDPANQKFVENLVILRETNPLIYKTLMSWD